MEVNKANSIRKISSLEEMKEIPQNKENHRTSDEYERQIIALELKIKNYEVELLNQNRNTMKLCAKLDSIVAEQVQFFRQSSDCEGKGKDVLPSNIKTLMKIIEQQKSVQKQLKLELETATIRKVEMDMKENIMAQEYAKLKAQIQTLTDDLNRSLSELKTFKFGNKMQLMRLKSQSMSKSKDLKIAQKKCSQYRKEIHRLNQVVQRKSARHLRVRNEGNNMMNNYRKELEAHPDLANQISFKMKYKDNDFQKTELSTTVNDLNSSFAHLSQKRIGPEAKFKTDAFIQQQAIEERDKKIEKLKTELIHANELLKKVRAPNESTEIDPAKSTEVASQLIRADMSLTELYSLYVGTSNELEVQKREKAAITLQLNNILKEFSTNAPVIREHEIEFKKLIEAHKILAQKQEELLIEKNELKEKLEAAHAKEFHSEIERKKLKLSQSDLSRQIYCLLKEVEQRRLGFTSDDTSRQDEVFSTGNDVITKKLVEFKSIAELQENNKKLITVVRDLAPKLEDAETFREETEIKLQKYTKVIQSMQTTIDQQNDTFTSLLPKYEHYKKMYYELQNKFNEDASQVNNASSEDERRIQDLEQQLRNEKEQHNAMEKHYKHCIEVKMNNELLMNKQFDSMQKEVLELTSKNTQLLNEVVNFKEQINLRDEDISAYKERITVFENQKKNYEIKICEHEQAAYRLNDELMKAQRNLAIIEREVSLLREENSALKCEERKRYREQHNPTFSKNLETIKATLERLETERRSWLETRLDETERELSALRRKFKEEKGRYCEANLELMQQIASATEALEEERRRADDFRSELVSVHGDIALKTSEMAKLNEELQEEKGRYCEKNLKLKQQFESATNALEVASRQADHLRAELLSVHGDIAFKTNEMAELSRKYVALELNLEEAKFDKEVLTNQMMDAREDAGKLYEMFRNAQAQIKNISADYTARTAQAESQINELKVTEINLQSRISELEAKAQLAQVTSQKERAELEGGITHLNLLNSSLKEQIETLTKQLSTQSQTPAKPGKYRELSHQVNTLKGISTANKILLAKRDSMVLQMKHLNKKVTTMKKELILLRKKNGQLKAQIKELSTENISLRNGKWENALNERNWENSEEFKRHQTKYENLGEKLLKEKELLKRKNEEVYNLKQGMLHRESKIASLEKQVDALKDERRRAENDQKALQQTDVKRLDEILHLKNEILRKETLVQKLTEKLQLKNADLENSISKETMIRKIAKHYKTKFTELEKKTATVSTKDCGISTDSFELSGSNTDSDSNCAQTPANNDVHENRSTIESLNALIFAVQNDNEKLRKENDDLSAARQKEHSTANNEIHESRSTIERLNALIFAVQNDNEKLRKENDDLSAARQKEQRTEALLSDARAQILKLSNVQNALAQKVETIKREAHNSLATDVRGRYEDLVAILTNGFQEEINNNKEIIADLRKRNTELTQKLEIQKTVNSIQPMEIVQEMFGSATEENESTLSSLNVNETFSRRMQDEDEDVEDKEAYEYEREEWLDRDSSDAEQSTVIICGSIDTESNQTDIHQNESGSATAEHEFTLSSLNNNETFSRRMQDEDEVVEDKEAYEYEREEWLDRDSSDAEQSTVIICGSIDTESNQKDIHQNESGSATAEHEFTLSSLNNNETFSRRMQDEDEVVEDKEAYEYEREEWLDRDSSDAEQSTVIICGSIDTESNQKDIHQNESGSATAEHEFTLSSLNNNETFSRRMQDEDEVVEDKEAYEYEREERLDRDSSDAEQSPVIICGSTDTESDQKDIHQNESGSATAEHEFTLSSLNNNETFSRRMQDEDEVVEDKEAYEYEREEWLDRDSSDAEQSTVIICGSIDTESNQKDIHQNESGSATAEHEFTLSSLNNNETFSRRMQDEDKVVEDKEAYEYEREERLDRDSSDAEQSPVIICGSTDTESDQKDIHQNESGSATAEHEFTLSSLNNNETFSRRMQDEDEVVEDKEAYEYEREERLDRDSSDAEQSPVIICGSTDTESDQKDIQENSRMQDEDDADQSAVIICGSTDTESDQKDIQENSRMQDENDADQSAVIVCGSTDTESDQKDIEENAFAATLENNERARGLSTGENKQAVGKNEKEGMGKQLASSSSAKKPKSAKHKRRRASRAPQASTGALPRNWEVNSPYYRPPRELRREDPGPDSPFRSYQNQNNEPTYSPRRPYRSRRFF